MELQSLHFLREWIKTQLDNPDAQFNLRDKQVQAFRAFVSNDFTDEQIAHSYFKLPTGFGKTVMFSYMARAYFDAIKQAGVKKQKIIIIVPRLSLIKQTQNKLNNFAEIHATEYSGRKKDNESDVIITTYNSLEKLFGIINFNDVGLIFADEAHHMLGNKIYKQLQYYNNFVPVIGFTATPEYEVNRAVADMLNTEIFSMNIPESVESSVLCPVKNVLYRSSIVCDLSEIPLRTNGEYDYGAISSRISPNTLADEIARIYAYGADDDTGIKFKNLKAIINCPNAEIANMQANKINEIIGDNVAVSLHKVGIKDKHFEQLQQDFIDGKYSVACQVGTMTEGFDDVTVSLCINYPTRSRVKEEQTSGRVIRIDENNKDKIAFVIDTVFRRTINERVEDILYTAANAKQVLFKDIAGGMILYPDNFNIKYVRNDKTETNADEKVDFVDFDLITDKVTLMDLTRIYEASKETIEDKTDDWYSATELVQNPNFKLQDCSSLYIYKKLKQYQAQMPQYIKVLKPVRGVPRLCLHKDGIKLFLEKSAANIPEKTDDWLTVANLAESKEFGIKNKVIIIKHLQKLQDEMPEYIQVRRLPNGMPALCLHKNGRNLVLEKLGYKPDGWYSAQELADSSEIKFSLTIISRKLAELEKEMPRYIKRFKCITGGKQTLCLAKEGIELFIKNAGFDIEDKTDDWYSANELIKFSYINIASPAAIRKKLEELQSEMPQYIKVLKPVKGPTCLCLHKDGIELFLEKSGANVPEKTDDWLSVANLAESKEFGTNSINTIYKYLKKLQNEIPEYIQVRRLPNGMLALCLHKDGRNLVREKLGFVNENETDVWYSAQELADGSEIKAARTAILEKSGANVPEKTEDWLTIVNLAEDKEFSINRQDTISKILQKLQNEMPEYIQLRRLPNGKRVLCLHKDGQKLVLEKLGLVSENETDVWYSAQELADGSEIKVARRVVLAKLKELQKEMPQYIKYIRQINGHRVLCLAKAGIELFIKKAGFGVKTDDWLTIANLAEDKEFGINNINTIYKYLKKLQNEMPEYIQLRRLPNGMPALCLHKDGRKLFLEKAGFTNENKTDDWQSAGELAKDKTFNMNVKITIISKMKQYQAQMPQYIKVLKAKNGIPCLCLHKDGRKLFLEKAGFTNENKTDDWQSAAELAEDVTFAMDSKNEILKYMIALQPEMPESIKKLKPKIGVAHLCLLKTAREEFLKNIYNDRAIPFLPEEGWLSADELAANPEFALNDANAISIGLYAQSKKMPEYIKMFKPKKGNPRLYLLWDAHEKFLKAINFDIPRKTADWYSANELAKKPNFNIKSCVTINKKLAQLQNEMPQYIKLLKAKNGDSCLCLHKDGLKLFIELIAKSKTKSIQNATQAVSKESRNADVITAIKNSREPNK